MDSTQEYLTGNRRIRYPFADDSLLSTSESNMSIILGCFVDAYVQIKDPNSTITPKVTNISISGTTLSFNLIGGAEDIVITCTASKDRFITIQNQSDWCWYTFVLSSDGIKEMSEIAQNIDITNDELFFSDRCLGRSSIGVTSFHIYGGEQKDDITGKRYTRSEAMLHNPDRVITGDVTLQAGYNISFNNSQSYISLSGVSDEKSITLNAIPGSGIGRIPCHCDEIAEFKTPGILSSDGHSRFFNDTCYDLIPIQYSHESADLRVDVKCKACCTCEMYASIVNDKLVPLKDELFGIKDSIEATQSTYEYNVTKWNDRIENAKPEDIVISVTGVPLQAAATHLSGGKVSGYMSRCSFSATVRNDSFVTVRVELTDLTSNGDIFEKQVSYIDESLEPKIIKMPGNVANFTLPPGRSATMTCFVRLRNKVVTDSQTGFMAYVTVTAKQGDRVIVSRRKGVVI